MVIQVFLWEMLLRRSVYNEGLYKAKPDSDKMIAWVKYDLPARENPFGFKIRKTYGGPRRSETDAWESLGKALIREIMLETGYNVDDVNYVLQCGL